MNYASIPFGEPGDCNAINANKGRRVRIVRDFIGRDLSKLHTLDIGPPNAFGRLLGIEDNTEGDVNRGVNSPNPPYDLILCSEILEHFMNPEMVMEQIRALLKPGGICIVSTPVRYPIGWFQSPHHFTEYEPSRLRRMFVYAGFTPVRLKIFCIWDWWFMFCGFRPFLRVLFHRSQLWELR